MSHYDNAENHIKSITSINSLEFMEKQFGKSMNLYKQPQRDEYDDAYDTQDAFHISDASEVIEIFGVAVSDDTFRPTDIHSSGQFETGYLYIRNIDDLTTNDILEIKRFDGKQIFYVLRGVESFGVTDNVFYRYKLECIND